MIFRRGSFGIVMSGEAANDCIVHEHDASLSFVPILNPPESGIRRDFVSHRPVPTAPSSPVGACQCLSVQHVVLVTVYACVGTPAACCHRW